MGDRKCALFCIDDAWSHLEMNRRDNGGEDTVRCIFNEIRSDSGNCSCPVKLKFLNGEFN